MSIATKGLPINVEPTGRGEVEKPISEWPEVDGLKLSDKNDSPLSLEVLNKAKAVRVRVGEALLPALNLDDETAVLIHDNGTTHEVSGADDKVKNELTSPQFSPSGKTKAKDVSIYGNAWAQRKSAGTKSDSMGA